MSSRVSSINRAVRLVALLVLGLGALSTSPAFCQTKQDGCLKDAVCREHYNKALSAYDNGKYTEALPEFEEAYSRRQMPWLLLNIGRTLQRLGRPQEAIVYYERYKKAELTMDPETTARVNKYIEQAKALLEKRPEDKALDLGPPRDLTPVQGQTDKPAALNLNNSSQPGDMQKDAPKPIYKKWWFWTIIGVVVAGGIAGGVAGGLASQKSAPPSLIMQGDTVFEPKF